MRTTKGVGAVCAAMTVVGAVIGAGFASGEEIWSFFGRFGWVSVLFVVPLFFSLFFGFLLILKSEKKNTMELGKACFGKGGIVFDLAFFFCCFCLLSGMIAGLRTMCFGFDPLFLIAFCGVGVMLFLGLDGALRVNAVLLPMLICFLIFVCVWSIFEGNRTYVEFEFKKLPFVFGLGILYVAMNILTALPVLLAVGCKCKNKKTVALLSSIIICTLFLAMLCTVICCTKNKTTLPILQICFEKNFALGICCVVILIFATTTTIFSCGLEVVGFLQKYCKNRAFCVIISLFLASLFGIFGFDQIVKWVYPLMGILGVLIFTGIFFAGHKKQKFQ